MSLFLTRRSLVDGDGAPSFSNLVRAVMLFSSSLQSIAKPAPQDRRG